MKTLTYICLVALISFLQTPIACGHENTEAPKVSPVNKGKQSEILKLATGSNYFPFADSTMPDNGWSASLVKAAFESQQQKTQIDVLPWPRAYKWSKELKYDASFPYVYSKKRAQEFYFSQPVNRIQVKLFVMEDSPIRSLADIGGKRFCLPKGFSFNPGPEHPLYHYKLVRTQAEGTLGCLQQVHKKWSDIGFINGFYSNAIIHKHLRFPHKIRILPDIVSNVPLFLIVSKQHPQGEMLIKAFNQGLDAIQASGQRQDIENKLKRWLLMSPVKHASFDSEIEASENSKNL